MTVEHVGPNAVQVTILETDCAVGDEAVIPGMPIQGTCRRQICVLDSGTAATVDPVLGAVPNPAGTIYIVVENAVPGAVIDTQGVATYVSETGILYHRSRPNAGADNVVQTIYDISIGW